MRDDSLSVLLPSGPEPTVLAIRHRMGPRALESLHGASGLDRVDHLEVVPGL